MNNCIQCDFLLEVDKKFCAECGAKQLEIKSKPTSDNNAPSIGDKNIMSGVNFGKIEEYKITGNTTINKIEDETKKFIICTVSGKHLLRGRDIIINCPNCKLDVAQEYFNISASRCFTCDKEAYTSYSNQLDVILGDGIIDASERIQLDNYASSLMIDYSTKLKLEADVKERKAKSNHEMFGANSRNELNAFYKIQYKKAVLLLFETKDLLGAISILSSIHQENILHDETGYLYFLTKAYHSPQKYINDYEKDNVRQIDLYWEYYWLFFSYFKLSLYDQCFKIIKQNAIRFSENRNDVLLSEVIAYLMLFISNDEIEYLQEAKSVYKKIQGNTQFPLFIIRQFIGKLLNTPEIEWNKLYIELNEYEKFYLSFVFGFEKGVFYNINFTLENNQNIEVSSQQIKSEKEKNSSFSIKINDLNLLVASNDLDNMTWIEAKKTCEDLSNGWRLPTEEELKYIYSNLFLKKEGNFKGETYWTNNAFVSGLAIACSFPLNGKIKGFNKSLKLHVRIVRNL